jgi:hypothetical protein
MAALSALWARVNLDSVSWAGAAAAVTLGSTAAGTDAVAVQGDIVAPRRMLMPMNAFALATMVSFPSRRLGKQKVKRKNDDARKCPACPVASPYLFSRLLAVPSV